jgi:hypothetical protein
MSRMLYGVVAECDSGRCLEPNLMHIASDGLVALAREPDEIFTPAAGVDAALDYGAVIERICADVTVVPMRYGSMMPDEAAIKHHLTAAAAAYKKLLEKLDGCLEMGVRILMPEETARMQGDVAKSSGHAYLAGLKLKYQPEERVLMDIASLDRTLRGLYRTSVHEFCHWHDRPGCLVSYLVPKPQLPPFSAALMAYVENEPHFSVSGPWPPWNFASNA